MLHWNLLIIRSGKKSMKNREIFMGFVLLMITLCLFVIANNHDRQKKLEKDFSDSSIEEEESPVINDLPDYYDNERIIIIGDSRMYGASKVVNQKNIIFIAKNGATCNYLWQIAEKETDKILAENPDEHFSIFVNLGVNDLDAIAAGKSANGEYICDAKMYSDYYKALKEKWASHNLFFASVNPVDESVLKTGKYKDIKMTDNNQILEFNETIKKNVDDNNIFYCDIYSKLLKDGFSSPDGLHYSNDTSKKIIKNIELCNKQAAENLLLENFAYFFSYKDLIMR